MIPLNTSTTSDNTDIEIASSNNIPFDEAWYYAETHPLLIKNSWLLDIQEIMSPLMEPMRLTQLYSHSSLNRSKPFNLLTLGFSNDISKNKDCTQTYKIYGPVLRRYDINRKRYYFYTNFCILQR
jgi:hypothetical protein